MERSFSDWLDNILASAVETATCSARFDNPVDVLMQAERVLIDTTGFNLNHQQVKDSEV
jgi:hypothetical protein